MVGVRGPQSYFKLGMNLDSKNKRYPRILDKALILIDVELDVPDG